MVLRDETNSYTATKLDMYKRIKACNLLRYDSVQNKDIILGWFPSVALPVAAYKCTLQSGFALSCSARKCRSVRRGRLLSDMVVFEVGDVREESIRCLAIASRKPM